VAVEELALDRIEGDRVLAAPASSASVRAALYRALWMPTADLGTLAEEQISAQLGA
jgi:hypothetical protein